jgi:hypothetical protein
LLEHINELLSEVRAKTDNDVVNDRENSDEEDGNKEDDELKSMDTTE